MQIYVIVLNNILLHIHIILFLFNICMSILNSTEWHVLSVKNKIKIYIKKN